MFVFSLLLSFLLFLLLLLLLFLLLFLLLLLLFLLRLLLCFLFLLPFFLFLPYRRKSRKSKTVLHFRGGALENRPQFYTFGVHHLQSVELSSISGSTTLKM